MTLPVTAACAASLFFIACMVGAGLMDLFTMQIRNTLVVALVVAYPLFAALAGLEIAHVATSVAVALVVFAVAFGLFMFGLIGGGDAKLAVATALWLGADHVLAYVAYTALLGAVLALVLLQFRVLPLPKAWRSAPWLARLHARGNGVPYGVPMAAAALLILPHTAWTAALN